MTKLFSLYVVAFPYVLFLNVLSFGSNSLGIGTTIFFMLMMLFFAITLVYIKKIVLPGFLFIGLSSFFVINIFKLFLYNIGPIDISFLMGGVGNWLFFLLNYVMASIYLKNNKNEKNRLIDMLSYSFMISSAIGILHYYLFFNIPFMDPSYGTDEVGSVFNVADYDLMRFRESSIFFGPNVNASMTVLGYLFLIFSIAKSGVAFFKSKLYWLGLTLHCWNIFISDSRSGILLIIFLTVAFLYDRSLGAGIRINKALKISLIFVIMCFLIIYIQNQPRFSSEALLQDERLIKIGLGLVILTSNIQNFLVGAPIHDKWSNGEIAVSDNLYIAILLYVGVIGFCILITTLISFIRKINRLLRQNVDYNFNLLSKYFIFLFFLIGLFSISIGIMPLMIYFGVILGGVKFNYKK